MVWGAVKMTRALRILTLTLCSVALVLPGYAGQSPPRFLFHQGETLTYRVHLSAKGTGGTSAYACDLDGQVGLTVSKIHPDGTAEVQMSTSGKGNLDYGGESARYGEEPRPRLVLVMKPNGTIAELRDLKGAKTSLLKDMFNLFNAGAVIQAYAVGSYTMFGLQLPAKSLAPGEKWTGVHKREHGTGAQLDLAKMKVELQSESVSFTYVGPRECQGKTCVAISCSSGLKFGMRGNQTNIPGTFCFDSAEGRLISFDVHLAGWGTEKLDFDYSVVLDKVTPPGAKPGS